MTITETPPDVAVPATTPRPAAVPVGAAGASYVAAFLALLVVAVGALAVRDAAVAAGWLGGIRWIPIVGDVGGDAVHGLVPAGWMLPAGVAVAAVGIALVVTALAPRRKTATALVADTTVYLARSDVARVASAAAQQVPGVVAATTKASQRKVTVRCHSTGAADQEFRQSVVDAVKTELDLLRRTPRVVVRIHTKEQS